MYITKQKDELLELMKLYMDKNHISYEELAKRMNVSYSSIFNWMKRGRRLSRISVHKIVDFLNEERKGMMHKRHEEY